MSQPTFELDPVILQALKSLVTAQAPRNRVMTLAEVEQAVFDLLKQVGTHVTQEVIADQIAASEKRGTGRRVVARKCAGSGIGPARC